MKQRLFSILIALIALPLGAFLPASSAQAAGAATFAPSPSAQTVEVGERFTVELVASPNGESLDTVRAYVAFPSSILRADGVELGALFPRQSPGNGIDNDAGTISEGGFILGGVVTQSGVFATITFTALAEGTATVEIVDSSRLIANGEEKGTGAYADATVTVRGAEEPPPASPVITVTSITHPDLNLWYKENIFTADWSVSEGASVTQWRTAFDQEPEGDPDEPYASRNVTKTISDIADGTWYFHIKGAMAGGGYTQTAHRQVRVDRTLPNPIAPTTLRIRYLEGEDALIEFATTDEMSGIDHYELSVNEAEYFTATSPYILRDLEVGDYFIEVKAVDRAGNARYGKTGIRAYSADTELKEEDIAAREVEQKRIEEVEESAGNGEAKDSRTLLITSVLAALLGIAILSAILRRKK